MRLKTKRGTLTRYAFACGYIERRGSFTLRYETPVYHVQGFDANGVRHWKTARTLSAARKLLRTIDNLYGVSGEERKRAEK